MGMTQEDVIKAFVERRNKILGTKYRVTSEPDKENRTGKAVDALCESEGVKPLAIEHTRLETFRQQIRDDNWFTKSVGPLEELGPRYAPWWLGITFFYGRGTQWGDAVQLVRRMRGWLDTNLHTIPVQKTGREFFEGEIPDVGMVRISKHKDSNRPGIYVSRTVPANVEFPKEGVDIMTRALEHKYAELKAYQKDGYVSVLLIDSRDIALTNHIQQYKAFLRACNADPKLGLDEIWVADIFEGKNENIINFLCFRGDAEITNRANPKNFMLGPEYGEYWQEILKNEEKEIAN